MTVCVGRGSGAIWQSKTSGVKVVSFCGISKACTKALSSRRVKVCKVFHGLLEDCMPTTGAHTRSPLPNQKKNSKPVLDRSFDAAKYAVCNKWLVQENHAILYQ